MNPSNQPSMDMKETSLRRLHSQFCNANNPMSSILEEIQSKLHSIKNLNYPKDSPVKSETAPYENMEGGITYELEVQMYVAHRNTMKAEEILRHLNEII